MLKINDNQQIQIVNLSQISLNKIVEIVSSSPNFVQNIINQQINAFDMKRIQCSNLFILRNI